jgi:hypothetical protein
MGRTVDAGLTPHERIYSEATLRLVKTEAEAAITPSQLAARTRARSQRRPATAVSSSPQSPRAAYQSRLRARLERNVRLAAFAFSNAAARTNIDNGMSALAAAIFTLRSATVTITRRATGLWRVTFSLQASPPPDSIMQM